MSLQPINPSVLQSALQQLSVPATIALEISGRVWLLVQFFAKCGILKEDEDGKPRVKLVTWDELLGRARPEEA